MCIHTSLTSHRHVLDEQPNLNTLQICLRLQARRYLGEYTFSRCLHNIYRLLNALLYIFYRTAAYQFGVIDKIT